MASNNKVQLVFVVNGKPVALEVNTNQPLHSVLGKLLAAAGVAGDADKERWEFKFNGQPLDSNLKIEQLGLPPGAEIFVNLKAGVVG